MSDVCDTVGADKHAVLRAVGSDRRIGNSYLKPGNSFGGPCFPRDTKALRRFVETANVNSDLLKATTRYNEEHIDFQANHLLSENKDEYVIEDICYKENSKILIIEESAKLKIAKKLVGAGKTVTIVDEPHLLDEVRKEYGNLFAYREK